MEKLKEENILIERDQSQQQRMIEMNGQLIQRNRTDNRPKFRGRLAESMQSCEVNQQKRQKSNQLSILLPTNSGVQNQQEFFDSFESDGYHLNNPNKISAGFTSSDDSKEEEEILRMIQKRKSDKAFSNRLGVLLNIARKYMEVLEKEEQRTIDFTRREEELQTELAKQHDANLILHKKLEACRARYCQAELRCSKAMQYSHQLLAADIPNINQTELHKDDHSIISLQDQIKTITELEGKALDSLAKILQKKNVLLSQLSAKSEKQEEGNKAMCIICQERTIDCMFHPCNHACTCQLCAKSLKICPMDRHPFASVKRIFLS